MAHGGKRKGAGRPKGVAIGTKQERLDAELGKGQTTPLKYMLNLLNNPQVSVEKKMWAAKESAPYVHSKLCLLYTSPSPRDGLLSRMPSSA